MDAESIPQIVKGNLTVNEHSELEKIATQRYERTGRIHYRATVDDGTVATLRLVIAH